MEIRAGLGPQTSSLDLDGTCSKMRGKSMDFVSRRTSITALAPAAPALGCGPVPSLGEVGKAWKEAQLQTPAVGAFLEVIPGMWHSAALPCPGIRLSACGVGF